MPLGDPEMNPRVNCGDNELRAKVAKLEETLTRALRILREEIRDAAIDRSAIVNLMEDRGLITVKDFAKERAEMAAELQKMEESQ